MNNKEQMLVTAGLGMKVLNERTKNKTISKLSKKIEDGINKKMSYNDIAIEIYNFIKKME